MTNILYDYWRSSSCTRVRIALALKFISYENMPISLIDGEQLSTDYLNINPEGLVPFWRDPVINLSQSLAIIEYLDDIYPKPKLLPTNLLERAKARQFAYLVSCDIHPLNNLRVKKYLNLNEDEWIQWYHHWLQLGFTSYETLLEQNGFTGPYSLNDSVTIADLCLVPQVYNAHRFEFNMKRFPILQSIYDNCLDLGPFRLAMPHA